MISESLSSYRNWESLVEELKRIVNLMLLVGHPTWYSAKESACQCKRMQDTGSISWLGRSPGVGNGKPLYILAWKIPWTEYLDEL